MLCTPVSTVLEPVYEGPALPPGGLPKAPEPQVEEKVEKKKEVGEWYEAMSEMGYPYYWNTVTGGEWNIEKELYPLLIFSGNKEQSVKKYE